jgi:uncharacterized protein YigE (DUF2233 family)
VRPTALLAVALGAVLSSGGGALAVERNGEWVTWYGSDSAPTRWRAPLPVVAGAVSWTPVAPGIEEGRLRLSGPGEAWRVGVVLLRIDPTRVTWRLKWGMADAVRKSWTIAAADSMATVALNAGMFTGSGPFGWTIVDGETRNALGSGALAPAFVVDRGGVAALVPAESLPARIAAGGVALAFQSYPELLRDDGEVPVMLRSATAAIDLTHRDGRLAIGELRDGRWLIALTRFEGAGGVLSFLPFGLTVPEMAAVMGALGCRRAVSLDGGVSAQLAFRRADGTREEWRGLRKVALGLELHTP